jgi:hypothetical protein
VSSKPDTRVAEQYLTWALEELAKLGCHPQASLHARMALNYLLGGSESVPWRFNESAKRFRDKADEAEQLAMVAHTASRRDTLLKIAERYRLTAEQMEQSSVNVTKRDKNSN